MDAESALIGHTGFVGSNLLAAGRFDRLYNSSSITDIRGRGFGRVVCAGVSAVKWWANANPAEDKARIQSLIGDLEMITADRFILISTVDVYGDNQGANENDRPSTDGLHAYGANRLMLEEFVSGHFPQHHIVRLPGLFGPQLKKNAIYDLLNGNRVEYIPKEGRFQWYPTSRLASDLQKIESLELPLINIVTEPVQMQTVVDRLFPNVVIGANAPISPSYDMRTLHAEALGGVGDYHMHADAVLDSLADFVAQDRNNYGAHSRL